MITSQLTGAKVEEKMIQKESEEEKEYKKKVPTGKYPALETSDGIIYETSAITKYIANSQSKLVGSNEFENA